MPGNEVSQMEFSYQAMDPNTALPFSRESEIQTFQRKVSFCRNLQNLTLSKPTIYETIIPIK